MIDITKDEYIILEIIPTAIKPENGQLVQLSAIKLKGFQLLDRFDYRLKEEEIDFKRIIDMIDYDKDSFTYCKKESEIYSAFKKWIKDLPLLYMDDVYTLNYIERYKNVKEPILPYLNETYREDVIERLIKKYKLQESNYIVDLLFESLIFESNNK